MKKSKISKNKTPKLENLDIAVKAKGKSVISRERKAAIKGKPLDWIALELQEAQLASERGLQDVAMENGLGFPWAHLNRGMQRMNLANVLRGKQRRGEHFSIGGRTPGQLQALAA